MIPDAIWRLIGWEAVLFDADHNIVWRSGVIERWAAARQRAKAQVVT